MSAITQKQIERVVIAAQEHESLCSHGMTLELVGRYGERRIGAIERQCETSGMNKLACHAVNTAGGDLQICLGGRRGPGQVQLRLAPIEIANVGVGGFVWLVILI